MGISRNVPSLDALAQGRTCRKCALYQCSTTDRVRDALVQTFRAYLREHEAA
ncbi:hypothetical protein [Frankia sp. Cr2]|uniref:hypothetical protein n=1 Tax=Frankia sp. Cr2 TaxID=3073932 RepID=UPI002AD54174|nr:hypothetical protein [Frankia sp. Cr2]